MKKNLFLAILITLNLMSCGIKSNDKYSNVEHNIDFVAPSDSDVVRLKLVDGEGAVRTKKNPNQTVFIEFQSNGADRITAQLSSPDSLANIRFSQIFLPDGTMDGPFGRILNYQLSTDGLYRISVHENMMAGDLWSGEFIVKVKLSGK